MIAKYVVTVGSDDGTFVAGDHIVFLSDGCVGCIEAGGWIDKEDVPAATKGMKYEVDEEWLEKKKKKLKKQLGKLESL